jgi:hypothetical protein
MRFHRAALTRLPRPSGKRPGELAGAIFRAVSTSTRCYNVFASTKASGIPVRQIPRRVALWLPKSEYVFAFVPFYGPKWPVFHLFKGQQMTQPMPLEDVLAPGAYGIPSFLAQWVARGVAGRSPGTTAAGGHLIRPIAISYAVMTGIFHDGGRRVHKRHNKQPAGKPDIQREGTLP